MIRSHGGGVYSFKKANNHGHKRNVSEDDYCGQSVVDVRVDNCYENCL